MLEDYYRLKHMLKDYYRKNNTGLLSVKTYVRGLLSVKHMLEDYYR